MIGLVDYTLQTSTYTNLSPPNLEIMKLAAYYRIEKQQFCRLIDLNETELDAYEKIYFFSEAEVQPQVPPQFLRQTNVIYGGTAFTNGIYQPFQDELIDFTLPRTSIYKEWLKQKYIDGTKATVISHILDDTYYRQYAGKNKLPLPAILPRKRLWIYDTDFFQLGWQDWVKESIERRCSSIRTIHPIICKKYSQYFELRELCPDARTNIVLLDTDIPLSEVHYMFKEYIKKFLADVTPNTPTCLKIGGDWDTPRQYYSDLIYKLNLLYCFWSKNIPIKIKYIEPKVGFKCSISNLSKQIDTWSRSSIRDWSINDKIIWKSRKQHSPAHEEEIELLKYFPSAKELFEQNYNNLVARGLWRI